MVREYECPSCGHKAKHDGEHVTGGVVYHPYVNTPVCANCNTLMKEI